MVFEHNCRSPEKKRFVYKYVNRLPISCKCTYSTAGIVESAQARLRSWRINFWVLKIRMFYYLKDQVGNNLRFENGGMGV